MTEEKWGSVPQFEGYYEISSKGRLRSVDRWIIYSNGSKRFYPGCIKATPVGVRYPLALLNRDGKSTTRTVHSLVAEVFIPNPRGSPLVLHRDDDPLNNEVHNLTWGTRSDNRNDAVKNGGDHWSSRSFCKYGHAFSEENTRRGKAGDRICKQCDRDRGARYRKRKRDARELKHRPTFDRIAAWGEEN